MIPASAKPKQVEGAKKVMQQIVAKSLNGSQAELIFEDGYPPMGLTDGNKSCLHCIAKQAKT
ncbi:hypothetical protein ACOBV8_21920 (plasmid) [Pseudoalteromonas espejiana]